MGHPSDRAKKKIVSRRRVYREMKDDEMQDNRPASDVEFTPSVKTIQKRLGSRKNDARMEKGSAAHHTAIHSGRVRSLDR